MQEHPWLDRLYVKLALQVKKTEQKTKKLALIELKMQKKKSRKPGEPTPATRSSGGHADGLWNYREIHPQGWALLQPMTSESKKKSCGDRTTDQPAL